MRLKLLKGLKEAEGLLSRLDPLDLSELPKEVVARTRQLFGEGVTPEQSVVQMLRDVRQQGDAALRRYAELLDGARLDEFRVSDAEINQARESISDELNQALELAARRVTQFHQSTLPKSWVDLEQGLGELVRPLEQIGRASCRERV